MPALALVGLADIPALIMLGQAIGDRSNRYLFSRSRTHGLRWPSKSASPPDYIFSPAPQGNGPLALVLRYRRLFLNGILKQCCRACESRRSLFQSPHMRWFQTGMLSTHSGMNFKSI